jgi:ATP-dependent Lhr-like helicase
LLAYPYFQNKTASFSIAMNDYGFELLTDEDIPIEQALEDADFSLSITL